jgi:uncharacterized membrane protein
MNEYVMFKFVHIFIAVIALGTSAGLGIVLEFYGNHPTHGGFVLRMISRLIALVVAPGYLLMLATGLWLANLSSAFSAAWVRAALGLWIVGAVLLGLSYIALRKQIAAFVANGPNMRGYRVFFLLGRVLGGATGFIVVTILYLMVVKPSGLFGVTF